MDVLKGETLHNPSQHKVLERNLVYRESKKIFDHLYFDDLLPTDAIA